MGDIGLRTMAVFFIILAGILAIPQTGQSDDTVVYGVYRPLDLGNPGEAAPQKDYYINMGTVQGVHAGSLLQVIRKIPTYDLTNQKLFKDVSFPIATLKVIYSDSTTAIARLEKMQPPEKIPAILPRAVMVGDAVTRER